MYILHIEKKTPKKFFAEHTKIWSYPGIEIITETGKLNKRK